MWSNIIAGMILAVLTGVFVVWFFGKLIDMTGQNSKHNS